MRAKSFLNLTALTLYGCNGTRMDLCSTDPHHQLLLTQTYSVLILRLGEMR